MPEVDLSKNCCISHERLSAFFDGEEILSIHEQAHMQICNECRDRLGHFKHIHSCINTALDKACPDDIAERVMKGFKEKLRIHEGIDYDYEKQKSIHRRTDASMWFARIAALVAFACLLSYFVFMAGRRSAGIDTASNKQQGTGVPAELAENSHFGSVKYSDVSKISFVGSGPVQETESPAKIDSFVKHVWITKFQESDTAVKLMEMLALDGLKKDSVLVKQEKGVVTVSGEMTARQAAQFVRMCRSSGCSLLSPQQPQPEQSHFIGTGTEPVFYEAQFVLPSNK